LWFALSPQQRHLIAIEADVKKTMCKTCEKECDGLVSVGRKQEKIDKDLTRLHAYLLVAGGVFALVVFAMLYFMDRLGR